LWSEAKPAGLGDEHSHLNGHRVFKKSQGVNLSQARSLDWCGFAGLLREDGRGGVFIRRKGKGAEAWQLE